MVTKEAIMIVAGMLSLFLSVQAEPQRNDFTVIDSRGSKQLVCGSFEPTATGSKVRRCEWKSR